MWKAVSKKEKKANDDDKSSLPKTTFLTLHISIKPILMAPMFAHVASAEHYQNAKFLLLVSLVTYLKMPKTTRKSLRVTI